jgi:hypothetical protein
MTSLSVDPEIECLKLKKAINDNHRLAQKAAGDAVDRAILTGELLGKWKELLPHGKFEKFVDTHFEGSSRTARAYMLAAQRLSELSNRQRTAILEQESSISGLLDALKPKRQGVDDPISDKGKPGGAGTPSTTTPPRSGPASGEAADSSNDSGKDVRTSGTKPQDHDPRPPRNGKAGPGVSQDYGKCPNCASTKWTEDEFGVSCAKCHHPHGEPTGGADEDRIGDQRSKTVKTADALMRAFDDLNTLLAKAEHTEAIASCKFLLKTARNWK